MTTAPVRVDDPYVDNDSVPIAHGDIAQFVGLQVGRLIIDELAVESTVLADTDVTEIEVLTVASVRRRHAVARVRRVRQISTSGAVEARLSRTRVEAGTPLPVISRHACADEPTSGRSVVASTGVEA